MCWRSRRRRCCHLLLFRVAILAVTFAATAVSSPLAVLSVSRLSALFLVSLANALLVLLAHVLSRILLLLLLPVPTAVALLAATWPGPAAGQGGPTGPVAPTDNLLLHYTVQVLSRPAPAVCPSDGPPAGRPCWAGRRRDHRDSICLVPDSAACVGLCILGSWELGVGRWNVGWGVGELGLGCWDVVRKAWKRGIDTLLQVT